MIIPFKSSKDGTTLFCTSDGELLLLPTFFSKSCATKGLAWRSFKKKGEDGFISDFLWEQKDVQESTQSIVANRLVQFFNWLHEHGGPVMGNKNALDHHPALSDEWLNYYLNDFVVNEKKASQVALEQHLMALAQYYDYLAHANLSHVRHLILNRNTRETGRNNTKKRSIIRYLTPTLRNEMYKEAKQQSLRDECILRAGGQLGVRSKENLGFVLNDFRSPHGKEDGLKTLFSKMESAPQDEYKFWLQGRFVKQSRGSKGGLGRYLYIPHMLLAKFKRYFKEERPQSEYETLFVNNCQNSKYHSKPISAACGTSTFNKIRDLIIDKQKSGELFDDEQFLEEGHSYHLLRHSFGTDKFYEAANGDMNIINAVTTTHPIYILISELLGHSSNDKFGGASQTTRNYIHSCAYKHRFAHGD